MKEIIEKIERTKDKELAINFYNELRNSLRHIETTTIALLTILMALPTLFEALGVKLELTITFFSFIGLSTIIKNSIDHLKIEKLLRKVKDIIIEDPMDKEDIEIFIKLLTNPAMLYGIIMAILLFILTLHIWNII